MHFHFYGFCNVCQKPSLFTAENEWFRDFLVCNTCQSIPRERAIIKAIADWYPDFRNLTIHESSPAVRGASNYLRETCAQYSTSQYLPHVAFGSTDSATGFRSENLEALTFKDASVDLFITQDVMEHIFNPLQASKEVSRVLKPGGAHIFTVPLINKSQATQRWAQLDKHGKVVHLMPAEYHGNPVDEKGALVTMHYGYDLASQITSHTGCPTTIVQIDSIELGIRAEYIEVLVMQKPLPTAANIWS
jgi:Methyltransferase domain